LAATLDQGALELRTPATLSGRVVTPDMLPMANASIDLVALGTSDVMLADDDPTVPTYNRSAQTASSASGTFTIPVDVGSYDVIVKPPTQSNFAWRILYNVDVGSRTQFSTIVPLAAPIVVTGALSYQGGSRNDETTLAGAEVRAFTVIDEDDPANARSIEIARGQADSAGRVTLLLPPELQKSWIR
jgi:hypothetical protein